MTDAPGSLELRSTRSGLRYMLVLVAALFLAAGTLRYWQAWLYVGMQLVWLVVTTVYLLRHDRALMQRRLAAEERGEKERVQQVFFLLFGLCGLGILVLSGLDRRFGWSAVSLPVVIAACAAFAVGASIVFWVLRENTFASSVIEVQAQQAVIGTGPYRLVRHPMYTGMLLALAATPLALGSYCAELLLLPLFGLFVMRLLAEERLLQAGLPGYAAYMQQTRRRLLPGLW
jgi:protein-S-isoprenylcysteine O-methyltransferase Ste14